MKQRILIFVAVSLLWGSEWLFAEPLSAIPQFRLLAIRGAIAALALLPFALRKRGAPVPVRANMLLGAVVIALPTLLLSTRTDLSPGLLVLLFATMPILTSIFEGVGLSSAPALLGGLGGTAFLVRGGLSLSLSQAWSVLLLLLAFVTAAAALVHAKAWLKPANIATSAMVQLLTAAVLFSIYSTVREGAGSHHWLATEYLSVLLLATLASSLAYYGFYWLLCHAKASQATTIQWSVPLIAIAESALWLKHLPAWDSILGGLVAIASACFLLRAPAHGDEPLTLQITRGPDSRNPSQL